VSLGSAVLRTTLLAVTLALCPTQGLPQSDSGTGESRTPTDAVRMTAEEQRFLDLVNQERAQRRLHELTLNPMLVQVARAHSREMADKDYFDHLSPTAGLRTPMDRYLHAVSKRPPYACVGENLFYCSVVDVERGHQALMNSPGHRANILYSRFRQLGVGIYKSPRGEFWVTEMFLTNEG
jgi:uncharacterized protein YkwD